MKLDVRTFIVFISAQHEVSCRIEHLFGVDSSKVLGALTDDSFNLARALAVHEQT